MAVPGDSGFDRGPPNLVIFTPGISTSVVALPGVRESDPDFDSCVDGASTRGDCVKAAVWHTRTSTCKTSSGMPSAPTMRWTSGPWTVRIVVCVTHERGEHAAIAPTARNARKP